MSNDKLKLWERFQKYYFEFPSIGLRLDLSRMRFADDYFERMTTRMESAFREMTALEAGAIANLDENRMVGHYWLRNPALAPTPSIRGEIEATLERIEKFAEEVHAGVICGQKGNFKNLLAIGIGGSSLGPQFVAHALGHPRTNRLTPYFFDNTDSDGMERVLASIGDGLGRTLCVVVSKSGGTQETKNGMMEAIKAYGDQGLEFNKHAIAITRDGSGLHTFAKQNSWLCSFPMWDWVGGRTSELSAVGLLPAALQGIDVKSMLSGAAACDHVTRSNSIATNPAAQLALMWLHAGNGVGAKNMVVLPYRDRLELFSRYLQQLIMESIGKRLNRAGVEVEQGITVFGNKGATDQHSYIQQLIDGRDDFFAVFIEVLRGTRSSSACVDGESTADDFLSGFYMGTRQALTEQKRESITITIDEVNPFAIGVLIALFERAVGLYAALINLNAYHQPGVEAGKLAASRIVKLQHEVQKVFRNNPGSTFTAIDIANQIGDGFESEHVFKICDRLASLVGSRIRRASGIGPLSSQFVLIPPDK